MTRDWFEALTGFRETSPEVVREQLELKDDQLLSKVNGRAFGVGNLEILSLAELRARTTVIDPERQHGIDVSVVQGDVRAMHRDPALRNALFQVASQFNLLEMVSPMVTPEQGVSRYQGDHTQGPACAVAAGAATIYRNYFVPLEGQLGQTSKQQVDCLKELGMALGNYDGKLWTMRNGYAMCSRQGLAAINARLRGLDEASLDGLRGLLRIGLHWNVQVTDAPASSRAFVSQAFCSALPVAYGSLPPKDWEPFARLVLEAAYEATLRAAILNAEARGSNTVLLTRLGGGAFGNEHVWIQEAMIRAMNAVKEVDLVIRIVSFGPPDADHTALVDLFRDVRHVH